MSSSDLAISVRGLSKSYTIRHQHEGHITLAEQALARVRHPLRRPERETFWALDDVSFDVRKGEVLGIIGRNGAGKSTLLKVLSRITAPTKGEVRLYGRVGSLLEVGTGFHPELTGRENVYLNGSILGMKTKEIDKQFDAIVDFAGVEKFLDTPVKRYSSGMYVRLAFAVAAHLETELLLIDEVLAVGDVEFQRKCYEKIQSLSGSGRTVMLVSHNAVTIETMCTSTFRLHAGTVVADTDPGARQDSDNDTDRHRRTYGSGELEITEIACDRSFAPDQPKAVRVGVRSTNGRRERFFLSVLFRNTDGRVAAHCDSNYYGVWFEVEGGQDTFELTLTEPWLAPGGYAFDVACCNMGVMAGLRDAGGFDVVGDPPYPYPVLPDTAARDVALPRFTTNACASSLG